MHPGAADALVEQVKREAAYHLQLEVSRVRLPSAADHDAGRTAAVVEGVVRAVFRAGPGAAPLSAGQSVRLEVSPCVPVGHPEYRPVTPCILGETLRRARHLEAYAGPGLRVEHACVALLDAPADAPSF